MENEPLSHISTPDEDMARYLSIEKESKARIDHARYIFWNSWGRTGVVLSVASAFLALILAIIFRVAAIELVISIIAAILILAPVGGLISQTAFSVRADKDIKWKRYDISSMILAVAAVLTPVSIAFTYIVELWQAGGGY